MNKPNFTLPKTKLSTVVWYNGTTRNETLITTPTSNENLFHTMLGHRVGYSQIRAVKSVDAIELTGKVVHNPFKTSPNAWRNGRPQRSYGNCNPLSGFTSKMA